MFSGGALSRFTVFALGIMPYISASIIMQLMTYVVPTLEALKKEGEAGPPQDHAIHALWHAGPCDLSVARHRPCARGLRRSRHQSRLRVSHDGRREPGGRHDVPDVARRADHRARARQRHLDLDFRRHCRRTAERDWRAVRARAYRRDERAGIAVHHRAGHRRHLRGRVRRARATQDPRQLREAAGRQQGLWRAVVTSAAQAEHVGRDPADLRVVDHPAAGHRGGLVCHWRRAALAEGPGGAALARPADLCVAVRRGDCVLLLLLHRARLQQPRDRRQPEEKRRVHSWHPSRRPDRAAHRPHPVQVHARRRHLHHSGVLAARVPGAEVQRAVLFRRHIAC